MAKNGFGVNIMRVTRTVGLTKPRVSSIFFVIDNCLILFRRKVDIMRFKVLQKITLEDYT